jgi:hypothetical protein
MFKQAKKPDVAHQAKTQNASTGTAHRGGSVQPAAWIRALDTLPLQAKLTINQPGDSYEQEADRVAERVMRMPDPSAPALRRCACGGTQGPDGECAACRANRLNLRRKAIGSAESAKAPAIVPSLLQSPGQPLATTTRAFFEPRFGRDFGNVRIHYGDRAHEAARSVHARAFTLGNDIVFRDGEYAPQSDRGKRLLAHELAHVEQNTGDTTLRRAEVEDRPSVCSSLTDIKPDVNSFVNGEIAAARSSGVSPVLTFLDNVAARTGGSGAVSPVETFIEALPATKRSIPPTSLAGTRFARVATATLTIPSIMGFNIYDVHRRGLAHVVGAAALINGICVGADKLGHFFQQGKQYFDINRSSGTAAAESFGRATEIDRAGLGATGVYSNADLAANRDGLRFWQDLQANPSSLTFDISSYISQNWNEYQNPNFYEASVARPLWATQLTGSWQGSVGFGPARRSVTISLVATPAGTVTGTFSIAAEFSQPAASGTLTGAITYNTTPVSGAIPGAVLHGSAGTHSATPVSGVTILFDWVAGADRGKGEWQSAGEMQLNGTYGTGTSRVDRGAFSIARI